MFGGRHDIQHNDTQHNNKNATLSIMTSDLKLFVINAESCFYNVMLSVLMLNAIMLSVVAPF